MPLTTSDRQTLIGPALVGPLFGALCAVGVAALHSEYGSHMEPLYPGVTGIVSEALLTFALVMVATIAIFGGVPILLKRLASRHARRPDA